MRFLPVLLFLAAFMMVTSTLGRTPAFNPDLRTDTVLGDWRLVLAPSLYDPAEYAFQRGYGYIMAGGHIPVPPSQSDQYAPVKLGEIRAEAAVAALQTAVTLDPANAHAWSALGWAQARLARDPDALLALRTAWLLAPHNTLLADARIGLAGVLFDPELTEVVMTERDAASIRADAATLLRYDRGTLAYYRETLPDLAPLQSSDAKN